MSSARPDITFIVAGDPHQLTGGYLYDAHIVAGLRRRGHRVDVTGLAGHFPDADEVARTALDEALHQLPDRCLVVIDGLAMGALPEVVAAHAGRLQLMALVHHPLADETGLDAATHARLLALETAALAAVRAVVVTSDFTARRIVDLGMQPARVTVVEPGVDEAALATGSRDGICRLLCVATVTPRKGHDVLVAALATLTDLAWECDCIGALDRDPQHAAAVCDHIEAAGLVQRMRLRGHLDRQAVATAYAESDVFVLPSHYEGYGMVIAEALMHGLPIVTTTGGALAETLPEGCGLAVPPGDTAALRCALRTFIADENARDHAREAVRAARRELRDWTQASEEFALALEHHGRGHCAA